LHQSQEERVHASALRSLKMRAHSVYELKRKLMNKGMDEEVIDGVLSRLEGVGLLDDRDFTIRYVEYGFLRKSWGAIKVKASLREKGVPKEIVDEVFLDPKVSEMEVRGARSFVEKKLRINTIEDKELREKIITQLKGRGYRWDIISEVTADI
jgi:regulatory protein